MLLVLPSSASCASCAPGRCCRTLSLRISAPLLLLSSSASPYLGQTGDGMSVLVFVGLKYLVTVRTLGPHGQWCVESLRVLSK